MSFVFPGDFHSTINPGTTQGDLPNYDGQLPDVFGDHSSPYVPPNIQAPPGDTGGGGSSTFVDPVEAGGGSSGGGGGGGGGSATDNTSPWGFGPFVGLGALKSRKSRLTKTGKALEDAIEIGTKAIFKGAKDALVGIFARGATRVAQKGAADEINIGAQALGKDIIVRGSQTDAEVVAREVLRRAGEEGATRIGGRILAGLAGLAVGGIVAIGVEALFPTKLGRGELSPEELKRLSREADARIYEYKTQQIDKDLGGIRQPVDLYPVGQDMLGFPVLEPIELPKLSRIERLEKAIGDSIPDALRRAVERSGAGVPLPFPNVPSQVETQTPTPGGTGKTIFGPIPQSSTPTQSSPQPPRAPRGGPGAAARIGTIAGLAGLGLVFFRQRQHRNAAYAPVAAAANPVVPRGDFGTTPQLGTFAIGNYSSGSAGGYCEPRARVPRRKCLERAPVVYRSGARKGKAAGTKCLRYADRRS